MVVSRFRGTVALVGALLAVVLLVPAAAGAALDRHGHRGHHGLTPVVLFPAFHFTKLEITVRGQKVAPECPRFGSFEDWFHNDSPSTTFSQVCQDKLMTLRIKRHGFLDQKGVKVRVKDYGETESAPFYEPMYQALEAAGYVRDESIRVAGYDSRLTPDMRGFVERTKDLIEDTYRDNGRRPVHLVGHSNGPLYAQYLLTHTSRWWKHRYIHGFTPIAGNFPGQGLLYPLLFTGLNVTDFTFPTTPENAASSALMYLTAPSSYMSASDPRIFDSLETVVVDSSTGRSYTPDDFRQLFEDAGLPWAKRLAKRYVGFVEFADPAHFPDVDVYAEKGSGIETPVGMSLDDLSVGQVVDESNEFFFRDGDINQEDLTNDAVLAWAAMPCFHFSLTDNPGVDHFSLPGDAGVLDRLLANLSRHRSHCW